MNKLLLLASTLFLLTWVSCSNDEITPVFTPDEIENTVEDGTWIVTTFIDSGDDETHYFTGYNFNFEPGGILTASNGSNSYTGTWEVTTDDSDDDSNDDSDDDLHFNIHFNLSNNFEELNDDWHFISRSDTKIELIDISGGNGGVDYLTFERI